jgi:hypothetical protein
MDGWIDCVLLYNNGNYENKVYLNKYIKERYKYVKVCNSVYKLYVFTKLKLRRLRLREFFNTRRNKCF